jgi:hypothetical protein
MKRELIVCLLLFLFFISCKDNPTESETDSDTWIIVEEITPLAQSVLTAQDTIEATLEYAISNEITSDYGFTVSIKFTGTTAGQTFSIGSAAAVSITERKSTVSLNYPLELIWNHSSLKHPVSCYFYLHQYTSTTSSKVIAKTDEIVYQE